MRWQFVVVNHETKTVRVIDDAVAAYTAARVPGTVVLALPAPTNYSPPAPSEPGRRPQVQLVEPLDFEK